MNYSSNQWQSQYKVPASLISDLLNGNLKQGIVKTRDCVINFFHMEYSYHGYLALEEVFNARGKLFTLDKVVQWINDILGYMSIQCVC